MTIQERIDKLRLKKGWTQTYLADQIGISRNSVYSWYGENPSTPSTETIEAICQVFKITQAEFFAEVDFDDLRAQEAVLIDLFRRVPASNKQQILEIVRAFVNFNKA